MRIFGPDTMFAKMIRSNLKDGEALPPSKWLSKAIETAQKKVEARQALQRVQLAEAVMAEREAISPRLALLSVYRPVGSPAMHGQPVGSEYACDSSRRSPRVVSRPPGEGQLAQATRPSCPRRSSSTSRRCARSRRI